MLFVRVHAPLIGQVTFTPDEREERERQKQQDRNRRLILKEQRKEIVYFSAAIPHWLAQMGYAYWYKKNEKDLLTANYNGVKIAEAHIGDDAYYLRIDTKRLPRGVMIHQLRDNKTLETLSAAAGSQVEFHQEATGCWYSIETQYGRGSIPQMVGYAEMLKLMPNEAPPLSFPLGMGANQRDHWGDMEQMINLLVGGTKGGGKSNVVNVLLCTLLTRNTPFQLRVFLTDLKGGIEFADYSGIPHLGGDVPYLAVIEEQEEGSKTKQYKKAKTKPANYQPKNGEQLRPPLGQSIYTEPFQVLPMLRYVEGELERRTKLLAGRAKKISIYNKRFPTQALSYWLVVIDELATLMEDRRYSEQAGLSLAEIARKGRAVGIFLVLATQTPSSAIVPPQIANNMDSRLAFRTGSGPASGVLLGSGEYDASRLPNIPGRFIWKWGGDKLQMQAPYIADGTVTRTVAQLRAGKYVDARAQELAQKAEHLFKTALRVYGGKCQSREIYKMVKAAGIRQREVTNILEQYEVNQDGEPEITIDDQVYYLAPPIQAKRIARWLVPVADFQNGIHPDPNYDLNLVTRFSFLKNSPKTVLVDSKKSDNPIDISATQQNGNVTDQESHDLGQISEDEIEWGNQWHHLDEKKSTGEDIPDWVKSL